MLTKLRAWRTAQGYTLAEVAGLTGLSEAMLSRVETRQRNLAPRQRVVMARRLGVQVAELFEVEPLEVSA
ncbi:helix-turn-helix domain-containing protein [Actinophytocola oryzae]|uniref:Helix-turn-helix protein n=1 Tax=Actinophytocola oryzae TaxID=502181 RepID=A0A4R7UVM9_9PSEU|nr:helix-turn-helix transcriptional regulator [Actinophytocola oryzae]TDV40104.1 helix-turn-helix protein [Actinophytocola oryzae]